MKLRSLLFRKRVERELQEELNFHLELETRRSDAQHARQKFGNLTAVAEQCRDERGLNRIDDWLQDLRFAVRTMRRSPGFSVLAVLVVGLGIGAGTAVFSLIDAVFLKPLPFSEPDQLVTIWEQAAHLGNRQVDVAPSNYLDWKEQSGAFEDLAAFYGNAFNFTEHGEPERLDGIQTTPNLFPLLGVKPAVGRWFTSAEGLPDQPPVTILTYGLWQRRFGGDPAIVGRSVLINDQAYVVVGVMPRGFQFPRGDTQLWIATQFPRSEGGAAGRNVHYLRVLGRLKSGVSRQEAETQVKTIAGRLATTYPATNQNFGAVMFSLKNEFVRDASTSLWFLLAAALLVLIIAAANIASILVTRGIGRSREIAVRAALGASRRRVARQLIVEGLVLAGCGAVAGVLIAGAGLRFVSRLVPPALEGSVIPSLDLRMVGFVIATAILMGIAFGLAPLRETFRFDINSAFRAMDGALQHGRLRAMLVALETALAIIVVVCTGLIVRTILNMESVDPGMRPQNILTLRVELTQRQYPTVPSRVSLYRRLLDDIRALPGVTSAGMTTFLPYTNFGGMTGLNIEGRDESGGQVYRREISPDYLATIGVPLLKGRGFRDEDDETHPPVVLVTENAGRLFDGNPIGKRVRLGNADRPWATIVGVVGNIREEGLHLPSERPTVYVPFAQTPSVWFFNPRDLAIRVQGDPMKAVGAVRQAIWAINPRQTISQVRTLEMIVDQQIADRKTQAVVLSTFSITAISLAALGIYALLSFSVESRRKEYGIRIALGANHRDLVVSACRDTFLWVSIGAVTGLVIALMVARTLAALLYGVAPADPLTFVGTLLLLFGVGVLAAGIPAFRISHIDPMITLRQH